MFSFCFNCVRVCELLRIAEMHDGCLASIGSFFLKLCGTEQEVNAWIEALKTCAYEAKGLPSEKVYSSMLDAAFERRAEIRKGRPGIQGGSL